MTDKINASLIRFDKRKSKHAEKVGIYIFLFLSFLTKNDQIYGNSLVVFTLTTKKVIDFLGREFPMKHLGFLCLL